MSSIIFHSYKIGNVMLKNRIVRSATYEGAADLKGFPKERYFNIYKTLAQNNIGLLITGFAFISQRGRAMQKAQAGIDIDEKAVFYKRVTSEVHKYNCPIIMQIAHTGRQTLARISGQVPISSSSKSSVYFKEKPKVVTILEIKEIIEQFVNSSVYAKEAGFDGIQLHAAHGYLLHQFLLPETNRLKGQYGIDNQYGLGVRILEEIFDKTRERCGDNFLILVKISGNHDLSNNFFPEKFDNLIVFLNKKKFDAIEISYGTMDYALNIFRGDFNLESVFNYNPIFKTNNKLRKYFYGKFIKYFIGSRLKSFTPTYNLHFAKRAKQLTDIPIISVGGFRSKSEIEFAINNNLTDLVGLSRPFICEPDLVTKFLLVSGDYTSQCNNCNECVYMCDSGKPTVCYSKKINSQILEVRK